MPYLIDGNNLLGSWKRPQSREDGRAEVVRRVAAFCRARGARAVLVFDGGPMRADFDRQVLGALEIRYPPKGQDADTVIRKILDQAASAREIVVVTSDRPLYSYAQTRGATVLRAHEWNALERGARDHPRRKRNPSEVTEKPAQETDVDYWLTQFEKPRTKRS